MRENKKKMFKQVEIFEKIMKTWIFGRKSKKFTTKQTHAEEIEELQNWTTKNNNILKKILKMKQYNQTNF